MVKQQLLKYKEYSGQLINEEKSCFLVAPNTCDSEVLRIKTSTGFKHKEYPMIYLGCHIYVGRKKIAIFNDVVYKIIKKVAGCQGMLLSIGGKATLIKHALQSQHTHLLAALEPPKTSFKHIERQIARFFWGTSEGKQNFHWRS
ncbi:uncharacterized protein [Nicotiana tomentosiformis]|uniref:uncharacterized protein n=1 Tax=Nicotiana tomentosiformis TaxID=4098 RepID=UPI00388C986C